MKKNRKRGKGRAGTRLIAGLLALVLFFTSLGSESYALEATQAGIEEVVDKEPEATQAGIEEVVDKEPEATQAGLEEVVATEPVTAKTASEEVAMEEPVTALTAMEDNEKVFTTTIVNPHYKDVISVQELNAYLDSVKDKEILPSIGILSDTVYDSIEAAGAYLRSEMVNRVQTITINIDMSIYQMDKFYELLLNKAFEHTEECSGQEGDALERTYGGCRISYGTSGGRPYATYEMQYYTTLAQEQELTLKVNSIMQELQLEGKTEAEKVKLIHDKICELTDYDYTNLNNSDYKLKYTAYAALCQGTAVCQGYAIAFYRLCKEAQIPVRIITGLGGNEAHAWNIVKIGEFYYNIDCTWDGQTAETEYRYYLQNEIDFAKHTRDSQFDTEEFHLQYPMAEYSYGKETLDRLNAENLDRTLTSIEEEAVSTRAEGKPKLLVFIHPTDSNSIFSVESIAQAGLKDVDIVVTDLNKSPKETVQTFKNNYAGTNSEMIFCYDTGNTANSIFWSYAYAAGITEGVYYPMFCYIDADNKLQYFEYGAITGKHAEDVLVRACDYGHKKYTITYYLDGGTNSPENPSEFTVDMGTLELKTPTREGYDFDGWYLGALDGELLENGRLQLTAGNKKLYAKWSVKTYEATLNPNGGQLANNKITVSHSGVYPQLPVPTKEGYSFLGWYTQLSGGTKVEQGSSIIRNENHSLYARWEAKNITVLLDAKEGEVTPGTITVAYGNPYGNLPVPVREGYSFLGWEEENGTPVTAQTIMTNPETHKLYARWEVKKYTLTLEAGEGTLPESQKSKEITYGQAYGTLPTPTREGYQFLGWYTAQNSKISESTIVQVTENQALYARYQVINYSIRYELNGGSNHPDNPTQYNIETDSFTLKVPTGNQGADFEGWYGESTFTNKITQITKGSKGNITLYAGWKLRMPTFSIQTENIVAGQKIELISHNPLAKIYYTLDGTTPDKGKNLYTEAITLTEDVTIRAIAIAEGYISSQVAEQSFRVYTSQLVLDKSEISLRRSETETLRAIALPSGKTADDLQWISKNEGVVKVDRGVLTPIAVGTTVVEAAITDAGGERLVAECRVTILPNIYQVTFLDREGNTLSEQEVEEEKAASAPEMEQIPGYTFEGWDQDILRITESITVRPVYSLNTYTITYFLNGEPVETENPGEYTIEDEQITLRPLLLQQGEKFAGWYDNPEFTGEEILSIPANSLGNRRLYGKVEYERYTISYVLEEGMTQGENPASYTVKDIIQLKAPGEKEGFLFAGWYESQDFEGNPLEIIEKRTGNITLYPRWRDERGLWMEEIEPLTYTGKKVQPSEIKVYDGSTLLLQGKDYTVSYKNNINAYYGKPADSPKAPTVIIKGKGNYTGKIIKTFEILPKSLEDEDVIIDDIALGYKANKKQLAIPKVAWNKKKLSGKKDFSVLHIDSSLPGAFMEPGEYSIQVEGKNNYCGQRTITLHIAKEQEVLMSKVKVARIQDQTYTGTEIEVSSLLTVTYKNAPLEYGKDYSIEHSPCVEPGTHSVLLRGMGTFKGVVRTSFKIVGYPMSKVDILSAQTTVEYNGLPYTRENPRWYDPDLVSRPIVDGVQSVVSLDREDYEISYKKNTGKGNAQVILTGKNGYTGTKKINVKITAYDLKADNEKILRIEIPADSMPYEKNGVRPEPKVYLRETLLIQNKDYKLSYKNNKAVNTYTDSKMDASVVITGIGNFKGTKEIKFEIVPQQLGQVVVYVPDVEAGKCISKPKLTDHNGKTLKAGTDYEAALVYRDEAGNVLNTKSKVEPGKTVTVTITGKGNYEGEVIASYRILEKKKSLAKAKITLEKGKKWYYTGDKVYITPDDFTVKIGKVTLDTGDYAIISHTNNVKKGTARVTIEGRGEYGGRKEFTFKINSQTMKWWEKLFHTTVQAAQNTLTMLGEPEAPQVAENGLLQEGNTSQISENGLLQEGNISQISENSLLNEGNTSQISENSLLNEGNTSQISENNILRKGNTSQVSENSLLSEGNTSQVSENSLLSEENTPGAKSSLSAEQYQIVFEPGEIIYNGYAHCPSVQVVEKEGGHQLPKEGYQVTYENNINAGENAQVIITGQGDYEGTITASFTIQRARLTIIAKDVTVQVKSQVAWQEIFKYQVQGLAPKDQLLTPPSCEVTAEDTGTMGIYEIRPLNARAGENYEQEITYLPGRLLIAEEPVGYQVTFHFMGHGRPDASYENYLGIRAGAKIKEPTKPLAPGYEFQGWYQDPALTKVWDFEKDIVLSDTTLYARWFLKDQEGEFLVSEILPQTYTGKALKPVVQVYDKGVLLKANKDYKVTYKNNIAVNDAELPKDFSEEFPSAIIEGKGKYEGVVSLNFRILPKSIGQEEGELGEKIKLKYTSQLAVSEKKELKPFQSLSYLRKLKEGEDFEVELLPTDAVDQAGSPLTDPLPQGKVPKGSSGKFLLVLRGKGNYTGSIVREVVVKPKEYLIKNARITLGSGLKSMAYLAYKKQQGFPAGWYNGDTKTYHPVHNKVVNLQETLDKSSIYTVTCGKESLIYGKDFLVSYEKDDKPGTATMRIKGIGQYAGEKTVTFKLTAKAFSAGNLKIELIEDKTYTGAAITQNSAKVSYLEKGETPLELVYGKDYLISYSKNINVGTASMTFTATKGSGYRGSVKKTFKILPHEMKDTLLLPETENIIRAYEKSGVKPVQEIGLTNSQGRDLVYGKDYTLSYQNNKQVAGKEAGEGAPTIVVKGKGNYKGERKILFTIEKALLTGSNISITLKELAYQPKKKEDYVYRPKVVLKDGKASLSSKTDYQVEYRNHSQKAYADYYFGENPTEEQKPVVVIKPMEGGNYTGGEIVLPLPVYQTKLTKKNLHAVISRIRYSQGQAMPELELFYSPNNQALKMKGLTTLEELQAVDSKVLPLTREYYRIEYGKNLTVGANKGKVKILGDGIFYGGGVTFKFPIDKRELKMKPKEEYLLLPTEPFTAQQSPQWPNSNTDPVYDSYKAVLKEVMVPQAVKEVLEAFPETFSYLDGSDLGMGLLLYNNPDSRELCAAIMRGYYTVDENTGMANLERGYTLRVNTWNIEGREEITGILEEEQRKKLEGSLAGQIFIAMICESLPAGMLGRNQYFNKATPFPIWFKEGIDQVVGGGAEEVREVLGILPDMSVEQIREKLETYCKNGLGSIPTANFSLYYLAVMYLGSQVDGRDSVEAAHIAEGLDLLLATLRSGKSMQEAIAYYTQYESGEDFEASLAEDAADFVKRLMETIGSEGAGSLIADSYQDVDILKDASLEENIFFLKSQIPQ